MTFLALLPVAAIIEVKFLESEATFYFYTKEKTKRSRLEQAILFFNPDLTTTTLW